MAWQFKSSLWIKIDLDLTPVLDNKCTTRQHLLKTETEHWTHYFRPRQVLIFKLGAQYISYLLYSKLHFERVEKFVYTNN